MASRFKLAALALLSGWILAAAAAGQTTQPGGKTTAVPGPTFAQIYGGYQPDFLERDRIGRNNPHKLSLQPWFFNMAQIEHDYRVEAIVKKADELFAVKNWREAMRLYQEVINNFPNDLWRIEPNGIFVPSGFYCQRQLLRMPPEQIRYYRTLQDPEAKAIFERARKYYSLLDFAELAERYLATGYGDDALWELGNAHLDQGNYAKALFYYQQIRDYCTLSDVPADQLALRLATCYKHLGMEKECAAARAQYATAPNSKLDASTGDGAKGVPAKPVPTGAFFKELDKVTLDKPAYFRQARNPDYVSMGDYDLCPDLLRPIQPTEFVWSEPNPDSGREWLVRALPWVAGNYLYYKHHNVLFCRSVLSGQANWTFHPGGLIDWFDTMGYSRQGGYMTSPAYVPESDLLIQDGLVFSSVVKDGPSLVAVDRVTGQMKWARGAINTADEGEQTMRYLAPPARGPNVVYAGYVFDDIEGRTHLTSKIGVQCLDSRTGRLVWQREICLLTPPKFSTSRRVRRVRVYGTQPTAIDGVIYHCTNAGVISALDALSGTILWATRYPHGEDIHDLLTSHGGIWNSRPPLRYDGRLYVTPTDSGSLYCLDPRAGKVLWSRPVNGAQTLLGVNAAGQLVCTGGTITGIDPKTGKDVWAQSATPRDGSYPKAITEGEFGIHVVGRPTLTRGNKLYYDGVYWGGHKAEVYLDLTTRKVLADRWYLLVGGHNEKIRREAAARGEEPDTSKFLTNPSTYFTTYHRWSFERYGQIFELEVSPQRFSMWYDRGKVAEAVLANNSTPGLFNQAELKEIAGDRNGAIELYTRALSALPVWPTPFRTEINRQLFRLYNRQAEAAMRSNQLEQVEKFCYQMAAACTTSDDEIHTILAMAEVFQKQGRWAEASACLAAAIRHYRDVKIGLPAILAGDTDDLRNTGLELLKNLADKHPHKYYASEFNLLVKGTELIFPDYFSVLTPLPAEVELQTGQFATRWLQRLAKAGPDSFRQEREAQADGAFKAETDEAVVLKLIGEYPATEAAQKALDRLIGQAGKLPEPARRIALWRLNDAGLVNGLKVPAEVEKVCNITVKPPQPAPLAADYATAVTTLAYDANTVLAMLNPCGEQAMNAPYAFLGMRSKRRYANKFGIVCWDLKANKKAWEASEIRLKDKGDEEGFTRYYMHGENVIVHGWYDVLALSQSKGQPVWQFRVPYGFRIVDSAAAEDVMVLTDNSRTIAIHLRTGQLIWEANETGGMYGQPILRDNTVALVRRNPSGVVFRALGTGRLLGHVALTTLCEATGNPAVKWDDSGVPFSHTGNSLVLTDGFDFICVDLGLRTLRWQRRIQEIDRGSSEPLPYRFWTNDSMLIVLKPDYDSQGLEAIRLEDGTPLWHLNEAKNLGVLFNAVVGPEAVHGLHYFKDDRATINILAYSIVPGQEAPPAKGPGLATPKLLYKQVIRKGFKAPNSWLNPDPERCGGLRGRYFLVNVSDAQKRILLVVDSKDGRPVAQIEAKGFGEWGNYGEITYAVQGPYLALLSDKTLTVASPK